MTRQGKPRRNTSPIQQPAGFSRKVALPCFIAALAVLTVLGLHVWHLPIQVRVDLQVTAVRLTLADYGSLMNDWDFERLNLSGIETLAFSPQVSQQPRYQGNPQAEVSMDTKGILSGLDINAGSTLTITCPAAKSLKLQLPSLTLGILPNAAQPVLKADKFNPAITKTTWPNSARTLRATVLDNAQLLLTLADNENLNLLVDKQTLTVAQMAFEQTDYVSGTVYSSLENGKINYIVDDTKFDEVPLQKGQTFLIKPTVKHSLSVNSLNLDAKQGILSISLQGMAGQMKADGKDLLPSVLDRLWKHSLLVILFTVVASVFSAFIAIHGFHKDSKPT